MASMTSGSRTISSSSCVCSPLTYSYIICLMQNERNEILSYTSYIHGIGLFFTFFCRFNFPCEFFRVFATKSIHGSIHGVIPTSPGWPLTSLWSTRRSWPPVTVGWPCWPLAVVGWTIWPLVDAEWPLWRLVVGWSFWSLVGWPFWPFWSLFCGGKFRFGPLCFSEQKYTILFLCKSCILEPSRYLFYMETQK